MRKLHLWKIGAYSRRAASAYHHVRACQLSDPVNCVVRWVYEQHPVALEMSHESRTFLVPDWRGIQRLERHVLKGLLRDHMASLTSSAKPGNDWRLNRLDLDNISLHQVNPL